MTIHFGPRWSRPWGRSWTLHSSRLGPLRRVQSTVEVSAVRDTASGRGDEALEFGEPVLDDVKVRLFQLRLGDLNDDKVLAVG